MILLSSSNSRIKVFKLLALLDIFLYYDWEFLHVRNLQENLLFSTLILGSVLSDYVVFYGMKLSTGSATFSLYIRTLGNWPGSAIWL